MLAVVRMRLLNPKAFLSHALVGMKYLEGRDGVWARPCAHDLRHEIAQDLLIGWGMNGAPSHDAGLATPTHFLQLSVNSP